MTRRPFFAALFAALASPLVALAGPRREASPPLDLDAIEAARGELIALPEGCQVAAAPAVVRLTINRTGQSVLMYLDINGTRFGHEYPLERLAEPGPIGPIAFEVHPGGACRSYADPASIDQRLADATLVRPAACGLA